VAVRIPENASLHPFGRKVWECNEGFVQIGSNCLSIELPANAVITNYGKRWECSTGFVEAGFTCQKLVLPENAVANAFGSGWYCGTGYSRDGNTCRETKRD
jgi:hypothetical protein